MNIVSRKEEHQQVCHPDKFRVEECSAWVQNPAQKFPIGVYYWCADFLIKVAQLLKHQQQYAILCLQNSLKISDKFIISQVFIKVIKCLGIIGVEFFYLLMNSTVQINISIFQFQIHIYKSIKFELVYNQFQMLLKFQKFYPLFKTCRILSYSVSPALYSFSHVMKSPPPTGNINISETKNDNHTIDKATTGFRTNGNKNNGSRTAKVIFGGIGALSISAIVLLLLKKQVVQPLLQTQKDQQIFKNQQDQQVLQIQYLNISPEQRWSKVEKNCKTIHLKLPSFYVEIPEMSKQVSELITRKQRSATHKQENSFLNGRDFIILQGFPRYGKSQALFNQINRLRKQPIINQKGEKAKRNIYYFSLDKYDRDTSLFDLKNISKSKKQQKNIQEFIFQDLLILMREINKMPFEERKNTTLIIDHINILEEEVNIKSKQHQYQLVYFNQIYNLSKNSVNVICISNSDRFTRAANKFPVVNTFGKILYMPIPKLQQRNEILKKWWKIKASRFGTEVPGYAEQYFMNNYSSVRNMTSILQLLKESQNLVNDDQNQWIKKVKQIEQQFISKLFQFRSQLDKQLRNNAKGCKIILKGLLENYKLQKTPKNIQLQQLYPQIDKASLQSAKKVIDILSKAQIVSLNQIVGEIQMWTLKEYYQSRYRNN